MSERVVITGMGVVCPIGNSVAEMWEGLMTGRHGMNQNTLFDASTYPTTFDAEVNMARAKIESGEIPEELAREKLAEQHISALGLHE